MWRVRPRRTRASAKAAERFAARRRRWVRLLAGREFHINDVVVVWDALFADSPFLSLTDYLYVAMLMYIRDDCAWAACAFPARRRRTADTMCARDWQCWRPTMWAACGA